jgi:hypothetical protein
MNLVSYFSWTYWSCLQASRVCLEFAGLSCCGQLEKSPAGLYYIGQNPSILDTLEPKGLS